MTDKSTAHNEALLPCLKIIVENGQDEAGQWVILESLCLGIGRLHGRTPEQTAIYVEQIAERFVEGARNP